MDLNGENNVVYKKLEESNRMVKTVFDITYSVTKIVIKLVVANYYFDN